MLTLEVATFALLVNNFTFHDFSPKMFKGSPFPQSGKGLSTERYGHLTKS